MNKSYETLNQKLKLLSDGEEIGLTPEEASVYGIDYADEFLIEDNFEEEGDEDE